MVWGMSLVSKMIPIPRIVILVGILLLESGCFSISSTPSTSSAPVLNSQNATFPGSGTSLGNGTTISAPSGFRYSAPTIVATQGVAIIADNPSYQGQVQNFSISSALPAGLVLDSTTGIISGTPTQISGTANYTVTASNTAGSTTTVFTLTVTVPPPFSAPPPVSAPPPTTPSATTYDFAPGLTSNCWQWNGISALGWTNGGGSVSPLGNCTATYTVLTGVESMLFYPGNSDPRSIISTGVVGYQPGSYGGKWPNYFSYENYYGLASPDALKNTVSPQDIRMVQGLSYFNLVARTAEGMPNSFRLESVLDKVNAVGLSSDEVGTSMGQIFNTPYDGNKYAMAAKMEPAAYVACNSNLTCLANLTAKYVPNLGDANGNGLQNSVSMKIVDQTQLNNTGTTHFCRPGHFIGVASDNGHCDGDYGSHQIGQAASRMMMAFNLAWVQNNQVQQNYYVEIVPWIDGFNLIGAFQLIPAGWNKSLVLGYVPGGNGTPAQIYLNEAALGYNQSVTTTSPACPGNQYGVQQTLVPGGDWANYQFDISAIFRCVPWDVPTPADLSQVVVTDVYYGPNINGNGRVYWQLQNILTFKNND
jgi:hypothetical protein